jgi:hypothetical protein
MTSTELERLIKKTLEESGLLPVLDEYKSQFLEFPDGLFAELVLNDGSKLLDVESIGREIRESLKKQGVDLDVMVRSNWTVTEVGDPCPATGASGGLKAAWGRVPITLTSGNSVRKVEVDVGLRAVDEIKQRIEGKGLDEKAAVKEVVKEFVEMQLSLGGESYWDPIRDPQQELSEGALLYLFGHSSAARNLGTQR